jgi:hypothetical protein
VAHPENKRAGLTRASGTAWLSQLSPGCSCVNASARDRDNSTQVVPTQSGATRSLRMSLAASEKSQSETHDRIVAGSNRRVGGRVGEGWGTGRQSFVVSRRERRRVTLSLRRIPLTLCLPASVACYASSFSLVGFPPCTQGGRSGQGGCCHQATTLWTPSTVVMARLMPSKGFPQGSPRRISSSSHAVLLVSRVFAVPTTTVAQGAAHDRARRSTSSPRHRVRRPVPCRPW